MNTDDVEAQVDANFDASRNAKDDPPWLMRVAQVVIFGCGLVGAGLHAFPIRIGEAHQNWPNLDLTTIAWIALTIVAVWLPDVSEVGWGEFSVKTKRLRRASKVYETSLKDLAKLVQRWSKSAALYMETMSRDPAALLEPKEKTYADYVRDRMGEAYEMLATKRDETVRLGLWLYDPEIREIVFVTGFRLQPKTTSYKPGVGMIGKAFVENRHFNEADVRTVTSYKSSRAGDDPPYRAVLCEPVRWGDAAIGMITVDRSTIGKFDDVSEQIAQGLAAQCAIAVKAYEATE